MNYKELLRKKCVCVGGAPSASPSPSSLMCDVKGLNLHIKRTNINISDQEPSEVWKRYKKNENKNKNENENENVNENENENENEKENENENEK